MGKRIAKVRFRVGLFVYCQARTTKVLNGKRARGSWFVELLLLRPVTPVHSYEVFSKDSAMLKETSNLKNKYKGPSGRPVKLGGFISAVAPRRRHVPDWDDINQYC
jgi:hypothetical protein